MTTKLKNIENSNNKGNSIKSRRISNIKKFETGGLSPITSFSSRYNYDSFNKDVHLNKKRAASVMKNTYRSKNKHDDIRDNPFYPKNFNEYRHLTNPLMKLKPTEIKWSIELRGYPKPKPKVVNSREEEKAKTIIPPRFYEEDLEKYKKKKGLVRSASAKNNTCSNWRLLRHLTKSANGETVSSNQLMFETTLRSFLPHKGVFVNPKEWVNHTGELKRPATCYVKPNSKMEKYIMRPYTVVKDKVSIGKDIINRQKYIRATKEAWNWFGEHYSSPDYNDVFEERNFQEIKNYLCEGRRTVSDCFFQLGLRKGKNHKYEREKVLAELKAMNKTTEQKIKLEKMKKVLN